MASEQNKTFRERPDNIDEHGKRKRIKARQPKGKWYTRRTIVAFSLLLFFILAPIIKVGGKPFMLLDIIHRKFYLLGATVYSQDGDIMAIVMATVVVFVVLFTVVFGRLWCGWACPHTVFMEMVFRRIEYLFHGNYQRGRKSRYPSRLALALKHLLYFVVVLFFTNVFIMWFTGLPGLILIWRSSFIDYWQVYVAMLVVSVFYYWIYAYVRESVCTLFCPYGRMQGVLVDAKTITVAYDYKRGEPRKLKGDCVDCGGCVAVCPTGIDIRNGTQLECVNCTACIDECNLIMKRMQRAPHLIRFASNYSIETGKSSIKNLRTFAYSAVLLVLLSALIVSLSGRTEVDASLLRMPGTMYQEVNADSISNIYQLKIVNKTEEVKNIRLKFLKPKNSTFFLSEYPIQLSESGSFDGVIVLKSARSDMKTGNVPVELEIYDEERMLTTTMATFIGPLSDR